MRKSFALASITTKQLVRGKVLTSILFIYVLVLCLANFFGSVTIGDKAKVIEDFGLFSISIASTLFITIMGAALLQKEISRKTIFTILAKPVSRSQFLIGKFWGIFLANVLITVCMLAILSLFLFLSVGRVNPLLWVAGLLILIEILILSGAAIFFSSIVSTPLLAGVFTFALFLAGRSTESLGYFLTSPDIAGSAKMVLAGLYWMLPHLDAIYIGNLAVYGIAPSAAFVGGAILYAACYSTVLIVLSIYFFRKKEFKV